MVYQFDADIAAKYGVDEAIMIYNLSFWIRKNEANGKHYYDGRFWTYNSAEAFTKLFPFWTSRQVRRVLKSLEEKGIIVTGNYNSSAYDRTTWYAFGDSFLRNGQIHFTETSNGDAKNGKCIINNEADINPDNKPDNTADGGLFPSEPGEKTKGTAEGLCLFSHSRYFEYERFAAEFNRPEFAGVDLLYYYHAVADWSSQGGKKKRDWIATARNFMRGDMDKGKLHKIPVRIDGPSIGLDAESIKYLEM